MKAGKELLCLMLCMAVCLVFPVNSKSMADTSGNVTAANAAYQYIVGDMDLNREGEVLFYDMTKILSKLFSVPQRVMNLHENTPVRHNVLMDTLWNFCKMDTTLIERNYAAETEYVTYEQFFDALDYFYIDILKRHNISVKTANAYRFSGEIRLAFDDGKLTAIEEERSFPDGRVCVAYDGSVIIAVSPLALPGDLNLSSIKTMRTVTGALYYYSEQEKCLLLQTQDGLRHYDVIGNPACFTEDGISRNQVNEKLLDQQVTLYVTNYKKIPDAVVMIRS